MKKFIIKYKYYFFVILIVIGVIFLDQLTKGLTRAFLPKQFGSYNQEAWTVIPNFFFLAEHRNYGVAWSLFENNKFITLVVPFIALILFIYLLSKGNFKNMKIYTVGIALLIGGTIGNLIDRIFFGYVIDFLSFHFGTYQFPTFNIADSCLNIGVVLFCVDVIFLETRRKQSQKAEENDQNN